MRPPTLFLDVRLDPVGGGLATSVIVYLATFNQDSTLACYQTVPISQDRKSVV